MEISGLSPYQAAQVSTEPENQVSTKQDSHEAQGTAPVQETGVNDRVELVRTQNLASPPPEHVDIKRAVLLLRQVTHQLTLMERQDMRQLYQFERLRDLCCQLHGAAEA